MIAGIVGTEKILALAVRESPEKVLASFGGDLLRQLCCGEITEEEYLACILHRERWKVSINVLQLIIRINFHRRIAGMEMLLDQLAMRHELVLLSDHAREWIEYIQEIHPFLRLFQSHHFSYELRQIKRQPSTFTKVLQRIQRQPSECLFIDDSPSNIASAAAIGLAGIQFENAQQLAKELTARSILN